MAAGASDGASEDSREEVQASEILAAIERGEPVDYDGVIVEGDLDLSRRTLGPVHFNETEFRGLVDFMGTDFAGDAWFSGAEFSRYAKFEEAKFSNNADFRGASFSSKDAKGRCGNFMKAEFNGDADFEETNFSGAAHFGGVNFSGSADFREANFEGGAHFGEVNFSGYANFGRTSFSWRDLYGVNADFRGANFNGEDLFGRCANFGEANFSGNADFGRAEFSGGGASFGEAVFSGDADFFGAQFSGGSAYFGGAKFGGDANFGRTNFEGGAHFEVAQFSGDAYFWGAEFSCSDADFCEAEFNKEANFNDAQFNGNTKFSSSWFKEDALFENTTFKGELFLTRARYNKLFIRWHNIEGGLDYDDTAYLTLLKNFKIMGYFEDYDSCYFEYRKERRNQHWPLVGDKEQKYIRKPIDLFLQVAYGYGTKPLNALFFSLGIIIGFGAFWRSIGLGRSDEALDEYSLADAEHDSILEVLAFSATVFLSGTRLFIEPPPLPKIGGRSRSLIRGAFIFERVLGALFSILFFLAISGTVVRQL